MVVAVQISVDGRSRCIQRFQTAEDRMAEAAKVNGILDKAQDNAETRISTLFTSLGYDEVRFT